MFWIGHLKITSLNKSYYVCLDIFAMVYHTGPFKNFFAATWYAAEVYYIPLFVCYFRTFSVRVSFDSVRVGI